MLCRTGFLVIKAKFYLFTFIYISTLTLRIKKYIDNQKYENFWLIENQYIIQILKFWKKQAYSQQNPPTFSVKKLDEFAWQTLAIDWRFKDTFSNT